MLTPLLGPYDARKLDVWSCAQIYMVISFGGPLWYSTEPSNPHFAKYVQAFRNWETQHPDGIMHKNGTFPRHPAFSNLNKPSAMKLAYRMFHLDPAKRITIQEALNDPWVQGIEVCAVDEAPCTPGGSPGKGLDAGCKTACRQATKSGVRRLHHHLPSKIQMPFGKDYDD